MYERTIICLANSDKHGGRCVAGREVNGGVIGPWLRPVSGRPGHELNLQDYQYADKQRLDVMHVARITLSRHAPFAHQPENHLLASPADIRPEGKATWTQLYQCSDDYDEAFWFDHGNTSNGVCDRMSPNEACAIGSSLKLILVNRLEVCVRTELGFGIKRKVRARFEYHGLEYSLTVTDPYIKECVSTFRQGTYQRGIALICASLSEIFEKTGDVYRLAATIITPHRWEQFR